MAKTNKAKKMLTNNVRQVADSLQSVRLPGKVIASPAINTWIEVGEGNILRVIGATIVEFTDDIGITAAPATANVSVSLVGDEYVVCQCKYVAFSAAPTRLELLEL